jgi:hypothetical protein
MYLNENQKIDRIDVGNSDVMSGMPLPNLNGALARPFSNFESPAGYRTTYFSQNRLSQLMKSLLLYIFIVYMGITS